MARLSPSLRTVASCLAVAAWLSAWLVGAVSDTVTTTHEAIDREVDRVRWTG